MPSGVVTVGYLGGGGVVKVIILFDNTVVRHVRVWMEQRHYSEQSTIM